MLTRVISGVVLALIVAVALVVNYSFAFPYFAMAFIAFCAAVATYELLYNTGVSRNIAVNIGAIICALLIQVNNFFELGYGFLIVYLYVLYVGICALKFHSTMNHFEILSSIAVPILISFTFNSIYTIINYGAVHVIMLINYSCVCDAGAYFCGTAFGKHKLSPNISKNKTVEGSIGGLITSIIVSIVVAVIAGKSKLIPVYILITAVLCIIGMIGDLFASVIKRSAGIKDYGNIIPGHGGIMDRFDSILLIAPLYAVILGVIGA